MAGAVAVVDLGQAVVHLDVLAVGLVVMSQKISAPASDWGGRANSRVRTWGQAAFFGLDDGAGVAGDQAAQHGHSGGSRDKLTVSHGGVAFAVVHLARNGR